MKNKKIGSVAGLLLNLAVFLFSTAQGLKGSTLPYNESGRYFDSSTGIVWHEQAVFVYAGLSIVSFLLLIFIGYRVWKSND
ncbi:MAG: hypothetical protein WA888_07095 [Burkholderiaceae bacterium]